MSFQLVPFKQAIDHLNESEENRLKVIEKLKHASAIVMRRMGYSDIPDGQYDETTSPPTLRPVYYDTDVSPPTLVVDDGIKEMVLLVLGDLWENREGGISQAISDTVDSVLSMYFDPPFA